MLHIDIPVDLIRCKHGNMTACSLLPSRNGQIDLGPDGAFRSSVRNAYEEVKQVWNLNTVGFGCHERAVFMLGLYTIAFEWLMVEKIQ